MKGTGRALEAQTFAGIAVRMCIVAAVAHVSIAHAKPSAALDGKAKAVEFRVDATKLPEMAQWVEKNVKRPVEKWAGNVIALLDGKDAAWTRGVVEIVLETGEGGNAAPAWACGGKIFLNMKWATSCPQEAAGACVHEFAHVVQDYGPRDGRASPYANTPGWLVEGIADWVRWFNYEGKAGANRANGDAMRNPKYDGAYGLTASFLDYLARRYKRDVIVKLNKTCREGKYDEGVWKTLTGKDLDVLDMEWKKKLGIKVRGVKSAKVPKREKEKKSQSEMEGKDLSKKQLSKQKLSKHPFRNYRFCVDRTKSPANCMQLSEFELLDADGKAIRKFALVFASSGDHNFGPGEKPGCAVDGSLDTKWVDFRAAHDADEASRSAVWIQFHFDEPTNISGYRWYTANDYEERDPRDWRLLGSNDEANWVVVDKVEDFQATSDRKKLAFTAHL